MPLLSFPTNKWRTSASLMVNEPIAPGTMVTVAKGCMQGVRGEMVKYESKYYIAVRLQELGCALVSVPVSYVRRG